MNNQLINTTNCDRTGCEALLSNYLKEVERGSGCAECGRYRFFPDAPYYLYLITHPKLRLHKVGFGVMGKEKDRLQLLVREGWIVYGIWHHQEARKTFAWEGALFKALRAMTQEESQLSQDPMGKWVGQWSESIAADQISLDEIEKIIRKIISKPH